MAVEELSKMQKEAERERFKRQPTLDIVNNLEEIRKISEATLSYVGTLYPDMAELPMDLWHIVPRVAVEFMKGCYDFLNKHKKKDMTEAKIEIGDFIKFSIEYGTTENSDIDATFNPKIEIGAELQYDNDKGVKNDFILSDPPLIDENQNIEFICKVAQNVLKDRFGVIIDDWRAILHIFVAFIRQVKYFLVCNKDKDECGCEINLCEVVDLSIEKYDVEDGVEYCIQISPGQQLKLDSKDNGITETSENGAAEK